VTASSCCALCADALIGADPPPGLFFDPPTGLFFDPPTGLLVEFVVLMLIIE
jgi:hypothetical protein